MKSPQSPLTRRLAALLAVTSVMTLIGGSCAGSAEKPSPPAIPPAQASGSVGPSSTAPETTRPGPPRPKSAAIAELEEKLKPRVPSSDASPPKPKPAPAVKPAALAQTKPNGTTPPGGDANGKPAPKEEPELTDKKLSEEATTFLRAWVDALDRADEKALIAMSIDVKYLEDNVDKGTASILKGTLVPKNALVIRELVRVAKDKTVKLAALKLGRSTIVDPDTSIFSVAVPLLTKSTLEVEIGEHPVELEVRQAVRSDGGTWKVMEIVVTK